MAELDTIKLDRACFEVTDERDHKALVLAGDHLEVLECQECGWERMRTLAERGADALAAGKFMAVDPRTGAKLRAATAEEVGHYVAQPGRRAFRKPVTVGAVLVDEDTGPGGWHGGAGF